MAGPIEDLVGVLEKTQCECLNAADGKPLANVIFPPAREEPESLLESDCDAQLLIHLTFQQIVKVHSLVLETPETLRQQGPAKAILFVNKPTLDFSSAESEKPAQEVVISPDNLAGKPLELKFTAFQNVSTISIFFPENATGDEDEMTILSKLAVVGMTTAIEGSKPSLEQQKAAAAGDWLNAK